MPDLHIIGDSHTAALHEAAERRGQKAHLLYISGNHWHVNRMRAHGSMGVSAAWRPALQQQIATYAERVGGSIFPEGQVVLASIGYHLGRLAPLFARSGHSASLEDNETFFVSQAFTRQWLHSHRGALIRILRLGSKRCKLVVIAPPMVQPDPNATEFARLLTAMLRESGVTVFDPREEVDWLGQALPAHLRAPDGVHGNAAYGEEILSRLEARRLIPQSIPLAG